MAKAGKRMDRPWGGGPPTPGFRLGGRNDGEEGWGAASYTHGPEIPRLRLGMTCKGGGLEWQAGERLGKDRRGSGSEGQAGERPE